MLFTSTRGRQSVAPSETIIRGLADDGGLFVPVEIPRFADPLSERMCSLSYNELAREILAHYLTDFSAAELERCVNLSYAGNFDSDNPAPLTEVAPGMNLLELWHGPTCAFKDMALQLLPHLLTAAAAKTAPDRTMVILVATSGDTGKAALDGFADVPGTRIIVFYPEHGVSPMQKLQMTTQTGGNVAVCAIKGNFDDAQTGVKQIFSDPGMQAFLEARNQEFSSANSINFGRLAPQIVYYAAAGCQLKKSGRLAPGATFNVVVPTGNFGNILAAVYAKRMGIPIGRLICASNRNHILTDFIATGVYDRNREFHATSSPSMDILISSNLERLLYHLYGDDPEATADLMTQLRTTGRYSVSPAVHQRIRDEFFGGFCDDCATAAAIAHLYREHGYLCDTHTAVAVDVYRQYLDSTGDRRPVVIASTASPFKFPEAVLGALAPSEVAGNEFAMADRLAALTGVPIPERLAHLRELPVRHRTSVEKSGMADFIRSFLS